jgi:hypothetical protein
MMFLIVVSPLLYPEFIAVLSRNLKEKTHSSEFFTNRNFIEKMNFPINLK